MLLDAAYPTLVFHERESLREALLHRRRGLNGALRVYGEAPIEPAPRSALVRRTCLAIAEIDCALAHVHETRFGICGLCRQRLPIARLALRPLATHCADCAAAESAA